MYLLIGVLMLEQSRRHCGRDAGICHVPSDRNTTFGNAVTRGVDHRQYMNRFTHQQTAVRPSQCLPSSRAKKGDEHERL